MIKGISRQIIEIADVQNKYFEKAWLVIKPEYANVGAVTIDKQADYYLSGLTPPLSLQKNHMRIKYITFCALSALFSSVITAAVLYTSIS